MMEFVYIVVLLALVGYFVQKNIKLGKRIQFLESQIEDFKNPKKSVSSTFMMHKPHRGSRPSSSDRHAYSYDVDSMQKSIDSANISDSYRGSGGGFSGSGAGSSWSDSSSSSSDSSSSSSSSGD